MRKTYSIKEVIEREKKYANNHIPEYKTNSSGKHLSEIFLILATLIFSIYTLGAFIYFSLVGVKLGDGFVWKCFEPGCVVVNDKFWNDPSNKNLMPGIGANIAELNVNERYIVGKIGQPTQWYIEHIEKKYPAEKHPEGYFILDKSGSQKTVGLTEKEYEQRCAFLEIDVCDLRSFGIFSFMYDPTYWFMKLEDE